MTYIVSKVEKSNIQTQITNLQTTDGYISTLYKTANYTVTKNDNRKMFVCTGSIAINLPNCTTIPTGLNFMVKNNGTGTVTVKCTVSGQLVDTATSRAVTPGECLHVINAGDKYISSHTAAWIAP